MRYLPYHEVRTWSHIAVSTRPVLAEAPSLSDTDNIPALSNPTVSLSEHSYHSFAADLSSFAILVRTVLNVASIKPPSPRIPVVEIGSNALVVGGTSGIGYAIAKRIATAPNYHFSAITIVGRNKPKVMPAEDTSFRGMDASSMHELKQFAQEFRSNTSNSPLDLLVMTQGIMTLAGRTETSEGIDKKMALHYYGKQLLIRELSPIMNQNTKVLLVLDGLNGKPEKLNWDDLDLKETFSLANAANHCTVMNDAMVQYHAKLQGEDSKRFFAHAYPGVVDTTTPRNSPWYFRAVSKVASKVIGSTPDQCAERLLDGLYKSAKDREAQGVFWSCIDNHGKEIQGKKQWSEEETKKIADHTWAIVDGS